MDAISSQLSGLLKLIDLLSIFDLLSLILRLLRLSNSGVVSPLPTKTFPSLNYSNGVTDAVLNPIDKERGIYFYTKELVDSSSGIHYMMSVDLSTGDLVWQAPIGQGGYATIGAV